MTLPDLKNFDLKDKTVLLRVNYDVPLEVRAEDGVKVVTDDSRIVESLPTINYLLEQKAKIVLLSHLGRPEGKEVPEMSLKPVADLLEKLIREDREKNGLEWKEGDDVCLMENLRFNPGEEENDPEFAKELAEHGDFYINDAFAVSHRIHASVVGLPKLLPHAAGFDLLKEVENLDKLMKDSAKPVVFVFGGVKKDKLDNLPGILKWVDKVLIGGKFPELLDDSMKNNPKVIVGNLNSEGTDINEESLVIFKDEINKAGTVILAGPMGQYEEEASQSGTREVIKAIVESAAFKVAGGGDTESAISKFGFDGKFDFISSGGGAMLEYLALGDLPGLKALRE